MKHSTPGGADPRHLKRVRPETITLTTASGAHAEIVRQGAHVISWRPAHSDKEHLFVSGRAKYQPGVAIRGGVPVIFPQFSDRGPLDKHGFARVRPWQLASCEPLDDQGAQVVMTLSSDTESRHLWPHDFTATYTVTLHSQHLDMQLQITNTGTEAFVFTAALHTYLDVGDVATARLHGLRGTAYFDNCSPEDRALQAATRNNEQFKLPRENREAVLFRDAIDRVYLATGSPLALKCETQNTNIHAEGFEDTVVWNPWADGCKSISDMAIHDYQRMLCVEAATVINPIALDPHESWTGRQCLTSVPRETSQ